MSDAESSPSSSSGRMAIIATVVVIGLFFCCAASGLFAAIAIPNFISMQYRAKRSEVPSNVDGIRTAQLAHHSAFGTYVSCSSEAAAQATLRKSGGKVQHPFNEAGDPCWDELGWAPLGEPRGAYWVEVTEGGASFKVGGICDVDGDGLFAVYEATPVEGAVLKAPVYTY